MANFSARLKLLSSSDGGFSRYKFLHCLTTTTTTAHGSSSQFFRRRINLDVFRARVSSSYYSFSSRRKNIRDFGKKNLGNEEEDEEWDLQGEEEDDDDDDALSCFRGLVLDISYRPVNVVCWKRAICLEFMDKADVLEYYDQTVNSPSGSFYIPAVLRVPHLLQVIKRRRVKNSLSRKNILLRDDYTCQYCSARENLTIDHVIPISRGGQWTWQNLVAACSRCNSKKGQKTVEEAHMKLHKTPKEPKEYDIVAIPLTNAAIRMLRSTKGTPEEWHQYLGKPSSKP
ncbi:unnamed protein product [Cochlearia groenlandica]